MKAHPLICCAAYLMLAAAPARAQATDTTLKGKYEREAILLEGNKNKYSKDHHWHRIGLFGKKLDKEFTNVSLESKVEEAVYLRHRKRGVILLAAGGTVFLATLAVAPVIAFPVFLGAYGAGLGTYFVGAFNIRKSRRHLQKAIWLHNRDLLVKK